MRVVNERFKNCQVGINKPVSELKAVALRFLDFGASFKFCAEFKRCKRIVFRNAKPQNLPFISAEF